MNIELVNFIDNDDTYKLLHKWCSNKNVYEWFEQKVLSYDEIVSKYKHKLDDGKQKLFIIMFNDKAIGLVQIYKYGNVIKDYKNIYEYDLFIGDSNYLSKGIGTKVVNIVNNLIFNNYLADCIVLRPFKRNERAIKCYLKCGFNIIDEYDGKDTLGNNEKYLVLMKRS